VASFLGGLALSAGDITVLSVLALIAFALSIGACVPILLPRPDLIFALRGSVLFEAEHADPGGLVETHRRLSHWLDGYRDANQPTVERLLGYYRGVRFPTGPRRRRRLLRRRPRPASGSQKLGAARHAPAERPASADPPRI
jgi:hypothetical protein